MQTKYPSRQSNNHITFIKGLKRIDLHDTLTLAFLVLVASTTEDQSSKPEYAQRAMNQSI
jgi:hypothetical protein